MFKIEKCIYPEKSKCSKIRISLYFSNVQIYLKIQLFQETKIFENFKISNFPKSNLFLSKIEMFKNLPKNDPTEKLTPDRNLIRIITRCSYSLEMKLQYMKNTQHVAHFHTMLVLSTRSMFKQAQVPNKLGRFGTGFPIAPVLLFELLPSDGNER